MPTCGLPCSSAARFPAWLRSRSPCRFRRRHRTSRRSSRVLLAREMALLGLLEVVRGPLWAWLGAGEVPAQATVVGGAIVLAALTINELATFRRIMRSKLSVTRTSG